MTTYLRDLPDAVADVDMSGAEDNPAAILQALADADELGTVTAVVGQHGYVYALIMPPDKVNIEAAVRPDA